MKKIILDSALFALCAVLFGLAVSAAEAQQPKKVPRIAYLSTASRAGDAGIEAFRQGLRELGYVEGKNIKIEYRDAEGESERLPELAKELVRLKVDIIVAPGTPAVQAAKKATGRIPIVMESGDPVGYGLVQSLAQPGGNITGLTNYSPELSGKRLELLKESLPRISRVAVLRDPRQPPNTFKETQIAGQSLAGC